MELANPIASLISLPLQLNFDDDIGPADTGDRIGLNVQPVIPFTLNEDWNLISRTIVPIVSQGDVLAGSGDQFGLRDLRATVPRLHYTRSDDLHAADRIGL